MNNVKTPTEEIQYLGRMLTATTQKDTKRLASITGKLMCISNDLKFNEDVAEIYDVPPS